jgi:hypothetical protein
MSDLYIPIPTSDQADEQLLPELVTENKASTCATWIPQIVQEFGYTCAGIKTPKDDEPELVKRKLAFTALETGLAVPYCYFFERVVHNKYCDFLFKCGCTWNWDGGWTDCNFHNEEGLPKCPWCIAREEFVWTTDLLPFLLMLLMFVVLLYQRRSMFGGKMDYMFIRLFACSMTYFTSAMLVGFFFKLGNSNYPHFVFF